LAFVAFYFDLFVGSGREAIFMSGTRATDEQAPPLIYSVRARTTGLPSTEELIAAISERVPDPSIFEQHSPVFMRATASNRNLDAYYTRMAPSTLQTFAQDAGDGVSFLNSHNMRSLGFGQTFAGRFLAGGHQRTEVDFYVLRGLKLNETANDDFIAAVAGGSIKDVSVGFYGGWFRCGLCDARMEQFFGMLIPTCGHWPGDDYPVDPKDETKGMRTAFAWVEDAHLAELSAVNDGATPGAQITAMRARELVGAADTPHDTAERIARRYGVKLAAPARSFPSAEIAPPTEEVKAVELTPEQVAQIRLMLTEAGQAPDADIPAAVRAVVDEARAASSQSAEIERLRPFEDEVTRLRPLADEGKAYRADLVEQAITEGKRAKGDGFAEETYRGLLTSVPIETVKRMRDDWADEARKTFPGGRATIEGHEPGNGTAKQAEIPSAAFAS
jgi:hypothetical protein